MLHFPQELSYAAEHEMPMEHMQHGKAEDTLRMGLPPRAFGEQTPNPPIARSLSAPNFFADDFLLGPRSGSDLSSFNGEHPQQHQPPMPSLEAVHPVHVGPQQWEQFAPYIASPQLPLQQLQQWTSPTHMAAQGPPTTGGLTSCFASPAMLPTPQLPPSRPASNPRRNPQDPRAVLDSNIKKLKRRGRKLYEEMQAVAVKIQLLERARASYGP